MNKYAAVMREIRRIRADVPAAAVVVSESFFISKRCTADQKAIIKNAIDRLDALGGIYSLDYIAAVSGLDLNIVCLYYETYNIRGKNFIYDK